METSACTRSVRIYGSSYGCGGGRHWGTCREGKTEETTDEKSTASRARHTRREAWRRVRKTFDTKQESAHTAADAHKKVDVELFQRSCSAAQLRQLAGLAKCYRRAQRWHPVVTPMMEGRDMCAKKRSNDRSPLPTAMVMRRAARLNGSVSSATEDEPAELILVGASLSRREKLGAHPHEGVPSRKSGGERVLHVWYDFCLDSGRQERFSRLSMKPK